MVAGGTVAAAPEPTIFITYYRSLEDVGSVGFRVSRGDKLTSTPMSDPKIAGIHQRPELSQKNWGSPDRRVEDGSVRVPLVLADLPIVAEILATSKPTMNLTNSIRIEIRIR